MFDKDTLAQLRGMMAEVIHQEVPKDLADLMEHQIIPQFDDMHREFAQIRKCKCN